MTIPQLLADLVSSGQLSRALNERDAARRNVRALHQVVGADIPVEDHARALELLGAVLARFRDEPAVVRDEPAVVRDEARERVQAARAGRTLLDHWRAEHERLRAQLAADRRDLDTSQQRRPEVARG